MILRDGFVAFRSPVLQHFFDCPLQFAAFPEHNNITDFAESADLFEIDVRRLSGVSNLHPERTTLHANRPVIT